MWRDEFSFLIVGLFIFAFIGMGVLNLDLITSKKILIEDKLIDPADPQYFNESTLFLYKQIESANYCNTSYDCVNVGAFCPIGCDNFVNKERANSIMVLIDKLEQTCMFDCSGAVYPLCKNNKCEINYYGL